MRHWDLSSSKTQSHLTLSVCDYDPQYFSLSRSHFTKEYIVFYFLQMQRFGDRNKKKKIKNNKKCKWKTTYKTLRCCLVMANDGNVDFRNSSTQAVTSR